MPLVYDAPTIYMRHDPDLPDWETASRTFKPYPGVVVVERLRANEKIGSIYIPDVSRLTRYEDDEPIAGVEPSLGCVLASGVCELVAGDVVILRDGDGLEFEGYAAGDYRAKSTLIFYGRVVPEDEQERDPGYIEVMPWEESILGVVEGMDIRQMLGRNVLLERDQYDVNRQLDSGVYLPDIVSENATSEATVKMVGNLVTGCKVGDRVIYHPMACNEFFDPENKNLRVVRELAILAVI